MLRHPNNDRDMSEEVLNELIYYQHPSNGDIGNCVNITRVEWQTYLLRILMCEWIYFNSISEKMNKLTFY